MAFTDLRSTRHPGGGKPRPAHRDRR
jgi:hypothetical protein